VLETSYEVHLVIVFMVVLCTELCER
jgi:hypothetical protein